MQWCQAQSPSAGIDLNALLGDAQVIGSNHPSDFVALSACGHYSECEKDDLYFALNQADFDGHDCVDEAVRRGVKAVVCERLLPISIPQLIVPDTRIAYGQACQALAGNPSQRMNLIGVSGAVGKTVTSHLVHSILSSAGYNSGLASTIEIRNGDSHPEKPNSAPNSSPAIANELSKMCIGRCSHAVLEMPSIPLAQRAYSGVELDAAVITNIQRSNLAVHGNLQNCLQVNTRILDCLKPTGFAVVNADDRHSMDLLNHYSSPTLTFGIHKPAEVTAKILERNGSFQTFVISAGTESIVVRTSIIGKQHIYNCLAAATVALTMGIELQVIATGLESASLPGRMQRIDCGQSFGVWVDSAVSPSQLNGAISAITPICEGQLWCICSTDSTQSPEERKLIGEMLERTIEKPIITQTSPTQTIDYEPCHQVLDGFSKPESAHVMPDRQKAIQWALTHAKPQDAVLIVGAGAQPNGPFGQGKVKLTDHEICQAFLCEQSEHLEIMRQEIFRIDDYR